jgi:hypothetical protein
VHGEGEVQVSWSIAPEDLPPSPEGAREVVTSAALNAFHASVGHFLLGQPAVYEGMLAVAGAGLAQLPESQVVGTLEHTRNVYRPDAAPYRLLHQFRVYSPEHEYRAALRQEGVLSAGPPATWLIENGLGAAEVVLGIAEGGSLASGSGGACYQCMTALGDPGDAVDTVVLAASELDPADGASFAVAVDGRLQRIAPEDLGPTEIGAAARAGAAPRDASAKELFAGFAEVEPGRFERESPEPSETRVRCAEGGSRRIEYRTTWRIELGDVARSGVGDIEVLRAWPCDPIAIGGGS